MLFLQFVRQVTGGIFDAFFLQCSDFGMYTPIMVIIAAIYWCLDKKLGEYLLVSQVGSSLVNGFMKVTACIYRPWILDSRVHPVKEAIAAATGYSFPSGHTTGATSLFGGLALRGKFSKALTIALILCVVLVGFSRLYLGVHSILDVIFGVVFTVIVLLIFSKLFDMLEEKPNLDIVISCIGIIISILVVVYAMTKSYPMDYDSAGRLIVDPAIMAIDTIRDSGLPITVFACWPIERRFIKFSTEGSLETKFTRLIFGVILIFLIQTVSFPFIGNSVLVDFIKNCILGSFMMIIYPAVFNYFQNRSTDKS